LFANGMILLLENQKRKTMKDIFLFASVFIIGYICFVGVIVGLFKLFFPFFTKEDFFTKEELEH